jgi:hypothetical protein
MGAAERFRLCQSLRGALGLAHGVSAGAVVGLMLMERLQSVLRQDECSNAGTNAICITPFDGQYRNLTIESTGIHPVHVGYVITSVIRQTDAGDDFSLAAN